MLGLQMIQKREELQKQYKLVLTDIEMPVLDGFQMTKEALKLRNPPVIIGNSGNTSKLDFKMAKNAGMTQYLKKPISSEDFNRIIRKYYLSK